MLDYFLLSLLAAQGFCLFWLYSHYSETLKLLDIHEYFISLLDYNNLNLELGTRDEAPSLEEEAMLHTMELNLKEKATILGLQISFPERPSGQD